MANADIESHKAAGMTEAPTYDEIMKRIRKIGREAKHVENVVVLGQYDPADDGLEGKAGFAGRGTFNTEGREAGYVGRDRSPSVQVARHGSIKGRRLA